MKMISPLPTVLQVALLICWGCSTSFATTYTTLTDGAWLDSTNVWSTDGKTACSCTPGEFFDGDSITINHTITFSANFVLDGATLMTVNAGAGLSATIQGQNAYDLTSNKATINVNGTLSVGKYESNVESEMTISGGGVVATTERVIIDGVLNIDNGVINMSDGNFTVGAGGTVKFTNGSKIGLDDGNLSNSGDITICPSCCLITKGSWKNFASGTINGSGSIVSTDGNITNEGFWDVNIAWCSAG
ncbi:MAG: hypothetical protein JKY09_04605, partial [Crocinitomicaceae bacterium]|nr:hypothetical protein [Crocinitomicaceae bacterium]